jgi:hypothetical protein
MVSKNGVRDNLKPSAAPCPPDASESSRSRLYPRTEAIRSQRFLLLQVVTNLRDQLIGQSLFEQRPIRRRPGRRIGAKSEVFRVRGQQRIESFPGMGAPAGPREPLKNSPKCAFIEFTRTDKDWTWIS